MSQPSRYYLRIRGRVTGPVEYDQLMKMVSRGQVTPLHEISTDQLAWKPASQVEGLLPAKTPRPTPKESNAFRDRPSATHTPTTLTNSSFPGPSLSPDVAKPAQPTANTQATNSDVSSQAIWFYVVRGQTYGPVSKESLKELIAAQRLQPTDFIWRDGLSQWLTVEAVGICPIEQTQSETPSDYGNLTITPEAEIMTKPDMPISDQISSDDYDAEVLSGESNDMVSSPASVPPPFQETPTPPITATKYDVELTTQDVPGQQTPTLNAYSDIDLTLTEGMHANATHAPLDSPGGYVQPYRPGYEQPDYEHYVNHPYTPARPPRAWILWLIILLIVAAGGVATWYFGFR